MRQPWHHSPPSRLRAAALAAALAANGSSFAQVAQVQAQVGDIVRDLNRSITLPGAPTSAPATHRDSTGGVTSAIPVNRAMTCGTGTVLSGGVCVPLSSLIPPPPSCSFGQVFSGGSCVPLSSLTPSASCGSGPVAWGAGCAANIPSAPHGSSLSVSAAPPNAGSAVFQCNNGSWVATAIQDCRVAALPLVSPCASETVTWGSGCSASVSAGNHGALVTATDSSAPYTGTASFQCNNGSWLYQSGSCAAPPPSCTSDTVSWTVGANTCTATAPATPHGGSVSVIDSTAPTTGSATATCNAGTWSVSGSCSAPIVSPPPPPPSPPRSPWDCAPGRIEWNEYLNYNHICSATISRWGSPAETIRDIRNENTSDGVEGVAHFICMDGTWTHMYGSWCRSAPCYSSGEQYTWGARRCTGSTPVGPINPGERTFVFNREPGLTGYLILTCDKGKIEIAGGTCGLADTPMFYTPGLPGYMPSLQY